MAKELNVRATAKPGYTINPSSNTYWHFDYQRSGGDAISFPDANLRKAINSALGRSEGSTADITTDDALSLTSLNASSRTITDISGLEYFTRLTFLNLNTNSITDLSDLSGLTALTRLEVMANQVSDISPLQSLTSLNTLYVSGNQILDFTTIGKITSLTDFKGVNQGILYTGNVYQRVVMSVPAVKDTTGVYQSWTSTSDGFLAEPEPPSYSFSTLGVKTLKWTSADGLISIVCSVTVVGDPSDVVYFPDPRLASYIKKAIDGTTVYPPVTQSFQRSVLETITSLVSTSNLVIQDLTGISACINLTNLDLTCGYSNPSVPDHRFTDLTELSTLTKLTSLKLGAYSTSNTYLGDNDPHYVNVDSISHLSNLQNLIVNNGKFEDGFNCISNLIGLKTLTLYSCGITDISFMQNLTNIEPKYLMLLYNSIRDFSVLTGRGYTSYLSNICSNQKFDYPRTVKVNEIISDFVIWPDSIAPTYKSSSPGFVTEDSSAKAFHFTSGGPKTINQLTSYAFVGNLTVVN